MTNPNPVRCQKCGKPVGYVTVLVRGLRGLQQPMDGCKILAVCMDCSKK